MANLAVPMQHLVVFAAYLAAAKLGLMLAMVHPSATAVWPPTGIALAALLLGGRGLWPAIWAGAFVANLSGDAALAVTAAIATGNALETVVGSHLVDRFAGGRHAFERPHTALKAVLLAGLLATTISATVGVTSLTIAGSAAGHQYDDIWLTWWLGDAVGAALVAPLILLWSVPSSIIWTRARAAEVAGAIILLFFASVMLFGDRFVPSPTGAPRTFVCVPFLVWIAVRFGPREAAAASVLAAAVALWSILHSGGPFVRETRHDSVLWAQTFVGVIATMTIALAAAFHERRTLEAGLRTAQGDLGKTLHRQASDMADLVDAVRMHLPESSIASIAESSEKLRAVTEYASDGIVSVDAYGRIVLFNRAAEQMFDRVGERMLGRPLTCLVPERLHALYQDELKRFRTSRESDLVGRTIESVGLRKDGSEFPMDVSLAHWESRGRLFFTAIVRDISVRKRMELAAHRRYVDLEQAIQDRTAQIGEMGRQLQDEVARRNEIERARAGLAAIVESTADAVIGTGVDGIVTSWNRGAAALYGWTAEEAVGRNICFLAPAELQAEPPQIVSRASRGERVNRLESVRITKAGRRINVSLTVSPVMDDAGTVVGVSIIARDITATKTAEQERDRLLAREQSLRAEAEAANRMKDEFLATLSHELRTPLNAVLGWAGLIRAGSIGAEEIRHGLEAIERNAKAQARLITDLLDVSRIVSGKLRLELRTVPLIPVIEAAVDSVRPTAVLKGVHIGLSLSPDAEAVSGDPNRLQQIVGNLLSNAVKFTPKGGRVDISLEHGPAGPVMHVTDTGRGVRPEFLPHIFERFRQADSSTTRTHGGLGLGLAIVRHLVELHGGRVWAHSDGEGRGARFSVALPPAAAGSPADSRRLTVAERSVRLGGVRVLVVDDEPDARSMLCAMLRSSGAEVASAGSASEALDEFPRFRPDVLLSDIAMPGEDGYTLIRKIRMFGSEHGGDVPAAALTAYAGSDDRKAALSAGFQLHLAKPVDPVRVAAAVAKLAGRVA